MKKKGEVDILVKVRLSVRLWCLLAWLVLACY